MVVKRVLIISKKVVMGGGDHSPSGDAHALLTPSYKKRELHRHSIPHVCRNRAKGHILSIRASKKLPEDGEKKSLVKRPLLSYEVTINIFIQCMRLF